MISLCVMDFARITRGIEVIVVWGRPGTPRREIRARLFEPARRTDVTIR
jgi:vanillate/3-O-methylgallate O-demethylase